MNNEQFEFKDILIPKTNQSPLVSLNMSGTMLFEGSSLVENPGEFYWNIHRWIQEYTAQPAEKTILDFKLNILNSGSTLFLTKIVKLLNDTIGLKTELIINWYYESDDEELRDIGNFFKESCKGVFNLIEVDKI